MVSGTPIPVPQVDKADTEKFNKMVDEVHAKVVAQLQELYDRHKASYGELMTAAAAVVIARQDGLFCEEKCAGARGGDKAH
jgi:hypothetical protein